MKAVIILAPGFEEVEAMTPVDLLRRSGIDIRSVALHNEKMVTGSRGITLVADEMWEDVKTQQPNAVLLPGGLKGVENLLNDKDLPEFLNRTHRDGAIIAAICAAPLVLQKAGLLPSTYTCHPSVVSRIEAEYLQGRQNDPVVVDGRVITSRSVGTAFDWAVKLAETLSGDKLPEHFYDGLAQ